MLRRPPVLRVLATALPLALMPFAVYAQETPPPPKAVQTTPMVATPTEPAEIEGQTDGMVPFLKHLRWDAERRGPLLVVAPATTSGSMDRFALSGPVPEIDPKTKKGVALQTIAEAFNGRIVAVHTLTVLAPAQMTVYNTNPPIGDVYAGFSPTQKMRALMATLTPAQLSKLTGVGLSVGDLDDVQRPLFTGLLEGPLKYQKVTPVAEEGKPDEFGTEQPISEGQRRSLLLRLVRKATYMLPMEHQQYSYTSVGDANDGVESKPYHTLIREEIRSSQGHETAFGVVISQLVPAQLKPSQVDFDAPALDETITLLDAKTVGDLVQRIAARCRVEITADARLARLPVFVLGDKARSGDVLKAICWGISGAVRRVGERTFVVTEDIEGMGTRAIRLSEWNQQMQYLTQKAEIDLNKRLVKTHSANIASKIQYGKNDANALSPALNDRAEKLAQVSRYEKPEESLIPLTDLPTDTQTHLQKAIARHNKDGNNRENNLAVRTDKVYVQITAQLEIELPGVGTLRDPFGNYQLSLEELSPTQLQDRPLIPPEALEQAKKMTEKVAPLFPKILTRAVIFAPVSTADAENVVARAKALNMTHCWIRVADDSPANLAILKAAVAAGQVAKIPIYASVSFLSLDNPPKGTTGDAFADRTLTGETSLGLAHRRLLALSAPGEGEENNMAANQYWMSRMMYGEYVSYWLSPAKTDAVETAKKRVLHIAQTPSLSGLYVQNLVPPGYTNTGSEESNGGATFSDQSGMSVGYTLPMRLRCLRTVGVDPLDLFGDVSVGQGVSLRFPLFGPGYGGDTVYINGWHKLRNGIVRETTADLYQAIHSNLPSLPLLVEVASPFSFGNSAIVAWKTPMTPFDAAKDRFRPTPRNDKKTALADQPLTGLVMPAELPPFIKEEWLPFFLSSVIEQGSTSGGFVFDLTHYSTAKGLILLQQVVPKPDKPAPPLPAR